MCVFVCVYAHAPACTHLQTRTCMHAPACTCLGACTCMHASLQLWLHANSRMLITVCLFYTNNVLKYNKTLLQFNKFTAVHTLKYLSSVYIIYWRLTSSHRVESICTRYVQRSLKFLLTIFLVVLDNSIREETEKENDLNF